MAKLYVAVVFAFIAATVIVITGLSSDARVITVFLRSLVGFCSAGLVVYIIQRILAAQDIFDVDDFINAKDEETLAELEGEEAGAAAEDGEAVSDEEAEAGEAEHADSGEGAQFEPLSSDELTRMETPE